MEIIIISILHSSERRIEDEKLGELINFPVELKGAACNTRTGPRRLIELDFSHDIIVGYRIDGSCLRPT